MIDSKDLRHRHLNPGLHTPVRRRNPEMDAPADKAPPPPLADAPEDPAQLKRLLAVCDVVNLVTRPDPGGAPTWWTRFP